ncbi:conjugal transfer protein TraJ [Azospirillum sp. RWY-5-1]|uniref:Conjugal transfer protein TraJ n=1 Tax=Azospirillum oleiclasticum TaxID=2735135 RepID=A0ABX2TJ65_9PROT|nr:conjugal transfer protein TraJ [Azospirillum oleiclasticum]NYZ16875.1 conjugal transfer protein TraJ [Azospirillum oleiclasticum]NYZ24392.1 conjugal transfer protein TraJ [Azospirillum oleiclasticum]
MTRSRNGAGTRRTTTPITVWCLPSERAEIERHARAAGMSTSANLREVGVGYEPRSVVDYEQVAVLTRTHADLNRLGGLLKMWLTNEERIRPPDLERLLKRIEDASQKMIESAGKIVRSRT